VEREIFNSCEKGGQKAKWSWGVCGKKGQSKPKGGQVWGRATPIQSAQRNALESWEETASEGASLKSRTRQTRRTAGVESRPINRQRWGGFIGERTEGTARRMEKKTHTDPAPGGEHRSVHGERLFAKLSLRL